VSLPTAHLSHFGFFLLLSHFALSQLHCHNCRELEQQEVTHAAEIEALRRRLRSAQKRAQALRPASQPQVFSASNSANSGISSSSRHRTTGDGRAQRSDARRSSSSSSNGGKDRRSRDDAVSSSRQSSRQAAASSNSSNEQSASDAAAAERERAWQEALRAMDLWGV
jgi:hypothetical protein